MVIMHPVTYIQVEAPTGTFIASGVVVGKDTLLTNKHVVDATHGDPHALKAFPSAINQTIIQMVVSLLNKSLNIQAKVI